MTRSSSFAPRFDADRDGGHGRRRHAAFAELLPHIVGHLLERRAFRDPDVGQPARERRCGCAHTCGIAAGDRDNLFTIRHRHGDQALTGSQRLWVERRGVDAGALQAGLADRHDGAVGGRLANGQVHRHGLEAEPRRHVRRRRDLVQRRGGAEHHARRHEVHDVVAVAVLEEGAGAIDVVKPRQCGIRLPACPIARSGEYHGEAGGADHSAKSRRHDVSHKPVPRR